MKTDKPATAAYKRTLKTLLADDFRITNYGGGVVMFAKTLQTYHADGSLPAASSEEVVAVRASTGRIITREIQTRNS